MGKSCVFDSTFFSTPNQVLLAGDVISKTVSSALQELGFDSVVIMSLFRSYWAVLNCVFQSLFFLRIGTQALIFIFFCPRTFLPTILAYAGVELQRVTVASQSYTWHFWLCPACSEHKHRNILATVDSSIIKATRDIVGPAPFALNTNIGISL